MRRFIIALGMIFGGCASPPPPIQDDPEPSAFDRTTYAGILAEKFAALGEDERMAHLDAVERIFSGRNRVPAEVREFARYYHDKLRNYSSWCETVAHTGRSYLATFHGKPPIDEKRFVMPAELPRREARAYLDRVRAEMLEFFAGHPAMSRDDKEKLVSQVREVLDVLRAALVQAGTQTSDIDSLVDDQLRQNRRSIMTDALGAQYRLFTDDELARVKARIRAAGPVADQVFAAYWTIGDCQFPECRRTGNEWRTVQDEAQRWWSSLHKDASEAR